jgi:phage terminase large subunit-like protein
MKTVIVVIVCLLSATIAAQAYSGTEKNAFLKADANSNHVIEQNEIVVLIDELAANGSKQAARVKFLGIYGVAFRTIDTNGDEKITPAELEAQR